MLAPMEFRAASRAGDGVWLLLAELNHRVCNELQVALCALHLAKNGLGSAEPARFIEEAALRLEAFGSMHQLLDRQREHGSLAQRLEALCRATSRAKAAPQGIRLTLQVDDVATDDETAWTICVVASELMTNAFKHAFVGCAPGAVGVALKRDGSGVRLTVSDNGVGATINRRFVETVGDDAGLGSGIVARLAERLGGYVTREGGAGGTTATFWVPAPRRMQ